MTLDQIMPNTPSDPPYRQLYEDVGRLSSLNWTAKVDALARSMKTHQDDVYVYWFRWGGVGSGPPPIDFLLGAGHSCEMPFFFGWPFSTFPGFFTDANQAGRLALQKTVMTYLRSFNHGSDPNPTAGGLPVWQRWSNEINGPKSMVFDADFTQTKVGMMDHEFTQEEVDAQISALPDWQQPLVRLF